MLVNYEKKLKDIKQNITDMGNRLINANKIILSSIEDLENTNYITSKQYLKNISKESQNIDSNIIAILALHAPEAKDLKNMISFLKVTNEILRVAVNTRNFIEKFSDITMKNDNKIISNYAIPIQKATVKSLEFAISMVDVDCVDEAQDYFNKVLIFENKTNDLYETLEESIFKNTKDVKNFNEYHNILSALRESEKISDRAMSIAFLLL